VAHTHHRNSWESCMKRSLHMNIICRCIKELGLSRFGMSQRRLFGRNCCKTTSLGFNQILICPCLRVGLPLGRSSFDLAAFNHQWIDSSTLFLFRVCASSITIRLRVIMKRCSRVSLEIEKIILVVRRRDVWEVMLMMLLVWSCWWESLNFLRSTLRSHSDALWTLSRMLDRLFRLDYL